MKDTIVVTNLYYYRSCPRNLLRKTKYRAITMPQELIILLQLSDIHSVLRDMVYSLSFFPTHPYRLTA